MEDAIKMVMAMLNIVGWYILFNNSWLYKNSVLNLFGNYYRKYGQLAR